MQKSCSENESCIVLNHSSTVSGVHIDMMRDCIKLDTECADIFSLAICDPVREQTYEGNVRKLVVSVRMPVEKWLDNKKN
jgi:hypothetical protein